MRVAHPRKPHPPLDYLLWGGVAAKMASLRSSASEGEIEKLQKLLLKAIGNGCDKAVEDALEILCQEEDADYILKWEGGTERARRVFHYSPTMLACHLNKADIVKLLLDKNAAIYFRKKDKGGLNALHVACSTGNLDIVNLLVEKAKLQIHRTFKKPCLTKALKARTTKDGSTSLMFAVKSKNDTSIEVVKALLETEVIDLTQKNRKEQNVFHIAAREQKLAVFVELHSKLPSGTELLLTVDKCGWGVLHHACAGGTGGGGTNCDILEWLFDHVPQLKTPEELNKQTKNTKCTPLLVACEYQKVAVVARLVEMAEVDVSAVTDDLKNALHIAAIHDSSEIATLLMEKKSSLIVQQDSKGDTPLHIARKKASFSVLDRFNDSKEAKHVQTLKNKEGLTISDIEPEDVLPAEIKKGGAEAIEIYKNALKKGKRKILQCNLLILGQQRVGKTSLYRLLVGNSFEPDLIATRGIDNEIIEGGQMVDSRCISAKFEELTDSKIMQENDADFEDTLVEEFKRIKGPPPKTQKARPVSDESLISEIQDIKGNIKKRQEAEERKRRAEAEAMLTFHIQAPVQLPPAQPQPGPKSSKAIPIAPRKPEPQKPQPQPSEPKPSAAPQPKASTTPAKKKEEPEKPAEEAGPKQGGLDEEEEEEEEVEELVGEGKSTPPGPLLARRQSKAISKKLKSSSKKMEPKLRFNTLDFAGQPEYRPMHHCFITRRAIYMVVFNLQKVAKYLQDETEVDDPFEEIRYWLNSISAHISPDPEKDKKMRRLLLVGTHKNPKEEGSTPITGDLHKKINERLSEIFFEDKYSRCINHLHHMTDVSIKGDIFAAVENSIDGSKEEEREHSGAIALQKELKKVSDRLPFLEELYPILWLMFENQLREKSKRSGYSAIVDRATVNDLAHRCRIEDPAEIKLALKFFHEVGKICCLDRLPKLFLSDTEQEMLASLVLLDPKWLISVMKKVMEVLDRSDPDIEGKSIRDLEETGRASVDLLKVCLAHCFNDTIKVSSSRSPASPNLTPPPSSLPEKHPPTFEQLCLVLKAYGLIYPMEVAACSGVARSATDPAVASGSTSNTPPEGAGPESEVLLRSKSDDSEAVSVGPPTHYLIPCRLPPTSKDASHPHPNAVELYFDFVRFLPDEVFHRLICLMLARAQAEPLSARKKMIKTPHFTQTRCQFYFDECLWEIEHQTPHSVLRVSVLSYSQDPEKPSGYLKKIHAEFLYKICNGSGLEGLMYYGGPRVKCKECGGSGILQVLEYRSGEAPGEETPTRGTCMHSGCATWIDIDQPQPKSKVAATSGRDFQAKLIEPSDVSELAAQLNDIAAMWDLFVGLLGVPRPAQDQIRLQRANHPAYAQICLVDGLHHWVVTDPSPTVEKVIAALSSDVIDKKTLAAEIGRKWGVPVALPEEPAPEVQTASTAVPPQAAPRPGK